MGDRFLRIHFHSLRHWKCTDEYRKTKDVKHRQCVKGHKNSNTTDHHIQLVTFNSKELYSAVADTVEEA